MRLDPEDPEGWRDDGLFARQNAQRLAALDRLARELDLHEFIAALLADEAIDS